MICNLIVSEQVRAPVFAFLFYKRNKKTCSSCIIELYKQLGIFKNTREVRETLACGSCFSSTSLVFLKRPAGLYNSTMHSARFLFLYCRFFLLGIRGQVGQWKIKIFTRRCGKKCGWSAVKVVYRENEPTKHKVQVFNIFIICFFVLISHSHKITFNALNLT